MADVEAKKPLPYPKSVFFIISNEFCERFSYYGIRTILSIYLTQELLYSEDDTKVIYHVFTMLVYFFPLFGAMLADSLLGKFKTIFYVSIIYAFGNIVLSAASTTPLHLPAREIAILGLLLIAIGSGGIKPCVSAFGGDQFILPQQKLSLAKFFSMFYFAINAGSLLSTSLTPILRENVKCFGNDTCYPLAFGVPGFLMIVSVVCFLAGKKLYSIKKPAGNVTFLVGKCISHAVSRRFQEGKRDDQDHWLDCASDKFDRQLIKDIKVLLRVLVLLLPIPVFWSLFDQQGTGWTFQANRMQGDIGFYTILPDQMQVLNPLLILAAIPLFESFIYPAFRKINFLTKPLSRMTAGGLLAALAFALSALVELKLQTTYPILPSSGQAHLRLYNTLPCNVEIQAPDHFANNVTIPPFGLIEEKIVKVNGERYITFSMNSQCSKMKEGRFFVNEAGMSAYFIGSDGATYMKDDVSKSSKAFARIRTILVGNGNVSFYDDLGMERLKVVDHNIHELKAGRYDIKIGNSTVQKSEHFGLGGVYTVLIMEKNGSYEVSVKTISQPNSVHMLWLLPQYIILTFGEVMFSITGLEFCYSQAPISMKSVITACWLLTTAFGNIIVVIISKAKSFNDQATEFFLYAGLMLLDILMFAWLAHRYKYNDPEQQTDQTDNEKVKGKDNEAYITEQET